MTSSLHPLTTDHWQPFFVSDFLNKIRHQFPDEAGCRMQIIQAIENDRAEKLSSYKENWLRLPES
ncbi:MAG: hypothetical protein ACEQSO_06050, partial [Aquirufa sp.]